MIQSDCFDCFLVGYTDYQWSLCGRSVWRS